MPHEPAGFTGTRRLPTLNCAHCGKFIEDCQGLVDPCDWTQVICHRHICPDVDEARRAASRPPGTEAVEHD